MKKIDLTGQRFERLKVIKEVGRSSGGHVQWLCECDCGKTTVVASNNLRQGKIVSCGCNKREKATKHEQWGTRIYRTWSNMVQRCTNPNSKFYKLYGGRGITVCQEWTEDFKAFYDWAMANGYQEELQIDRIDNDKGYSPDNCRWITHAQNCNNMQKNKTITYNGETNTIAEWAKKTGISYKAIAYRLRTGKPPEEILKEE